MTLLSDSTIRSRVEDGRDVDERVIWEPWQRIRVEPFRLDDLQPCSYDVHLGPSLKRYEGSLMDTRRDNARWWRELPLQGDTHDDPPTFWVLQPGRFYLGALAEFLAIPEDICGFLNGVSTRARNGITPHQQAGLLDPGWYGNATLEITVEAPHTRLYPGQRIGQVTFQMLDRRCLRPYRGRYQGDTEARAARSKLAVVA